MGVTLLQSALYGTDELKKAISKTIVENSPILEFINFKTIEGNAYTYRQEKALPSIAFRGVNSTYTQSVGLINPVTETLSIMGGEVFVDNFEIRTQGNIVDIKAKQYELKSRAFSQKFDSTFFNGDTNVDPYAFDGLRKRLTGNQLIYASGTSTGASTTLTLAMLDTLLDSVPFDNKVLFMNRTLRRKVTALLRAINNSPFYIDTKQDEFGRQSMQYAGVDIHIVEHMNDASTILDFNENGGDGGSTAASIYAVSFGDEELVHGIMNGSLDVTDFGEIQSAPGHLGRIEAYMGLCVQHPRAAARLSQITNS